MGRYVSGSVHVSAGMETASSARLNVGDGVCSHKDGVTNGVTSIGIMNVSSSNLGEGMLSVSGGSPDSAASGTSNSIG
jgi:hypothetical protein